MNNELKVALDKALKSKKPMVLFVLLQCLYLSFFSNSQLTIGNDQELAQQISDLGGAHFNCKATDVVVDEKNRIVSTPANMVASGIEEVHIGIGKLVKQLADMV